MKNTNGDYERQLEWLFNQFPAFQKVGQSAYKPTLENTRKLIELFEIDMSRLRFVHIAGTNGKGTTAAIMSSYLTEAGFKTGLFTSPHIHDFRERIRVNGKVIDKNTVSCFIDNVQSFNFEISPSFFELSWVMALQYFSKKECDIVVVETGLGGRLDATNVITPLISVITNIGLDHTAILGNTLEEIAYEKAGIIKENIPVVVGQRQPETESVFKEVSKKKNAEIIFTDQKKSQSTFEINKHTARQALSVLPIENFWFNENIFEDSLSKLSDNTGFRGRFQVLSESPKIIADAAHNYEGISRFVQDILLKFPGRKIHAVYGASNDKDLSKLVEIFPKEWQYYFTTFRNRRSYTIEELKSFGTTQDLPIKYFDSTPKAMSLVQTVINKGDVIVVFGSFFLLEEII